MRLLLLDVDELDELFMQRRIYDELAFKKEVLKSRPSEEEARHRTAYAIEKKFRGTCFGIQYA